MCIRDRHKTDLFAYDLYSLTYPTFNNKAQHVQFRECSHRCARLLDSDGDYVCYNVSVITNAVLQGRYWTLSRKRWSFTSGESASTRTSRAGSRASNSTFRSSSLFVSSSSSASPPAKKSVGLSLRLDYSISTISRRIVNNHDNIKCLSVRF